MPQNYKTTQLVQLEANLLKMRSRWVPPETRRKKKGLIVTPFLLDLRRHQMSKVRWESH